MSMSQEEIEALMNGLDIAEGEEENEEPELAIEEPSKVDTKEIEDLISQSAVIKTIDENESNVLVNASEIENLLKDIEATNVVKEDEVKQKIEVTSILEEPKEVDPRSEDDIVNDWTNSRMDQGIIPTPAHKDTKVVNQLSQVANDSEEKVSKIFDVLSLALDNNTEIRKNFVEFEKALASQENMLSSLSLKFPNIKLFNEHLENVQKMNGSLVSLKKIVNDEDNSIFQAMELMQFNDINRQKIERVMFVIRKLSMYLNNLFEDDDESSKNIAVAKHIHGDDGDDLVGDDLDKLISDFAKNS